MYHDVFKVNHKSPAILHAETFIPCEMTAVKQAGGHK